MKIMILIPPFPQVSWLMQPPIAALYTAAVLKEEQIEISLYDNRFGDDGIWKKDLTDCNLVVVETAEYDLTQCYPIDLEKVREVIGEIRSVNPSIMIVCVGPHGCIAPELTLKELKADGILIGENEVVVLDFIRHQSEFIGKEKFIYTQMSRQDLNLLPIPSYELVDLRKYISYVPMEGKVVERCTGLIFANRGCPFNCEYCYTGYFGNIVRYRPVEMIIDEINAMYSQGVNNYFFLDYTFTADKQWVYELLDEMKNLEFSFTWGCETRIDVIDEELLKIMSERGCKYIWFGIESPQIETMGVNKKIKQKEIENIINLTNQYGIQAVAFILIGFENENIDAIYDWCSRMNFIFDHSIVVPRPGTKLFNRLGFNYNSCSCWKQLEIMASNIFSNLIITEEKFKKLEELPNYFGNLQTM